MDTYFLKNVRVRNMGRFSWHKQIFLHSNNNQLCVTVRYMDRLLVLADDLSNISSKHGKLWLQVTQ